MILGGILFFIILSLLVFIHEAGHFFAAKKFGMKVEEFGFGLPPRAWGRKIKETIYSINWLPIGGFVKLYGEDEAGAGRISTKSQATSINKDVHRAFFAKPVWQRATVVAAGVVMNAILAVIIFYIYFAISNFQTNFVLLSNYKFVGANQINKNLNRTDRIISFVMPDSPAEKIGIKAPARMISVNGDKVETIDEFIETVNKNKGKTITVGWEELASENQTITIVARREGSLTPRISPPKNQGPLGVAFLPITFVNYSSDQQKLISGLLHPVNVMAYNFDILGKLFAVSVKEKTVAPVGEGVSGPIGILSVFLDIGKIQDIKYQLLQYLNIAGMLSASLAIFNILPIPALDGGRLFFIIIEGITGKKVSPKVENAIHSVGMAILLTLILLVTFKDLLRFFQ